MELLPNELRYLIDGNVVRRFPDRLIPLNNPFHNKIADIPRNATYLDPAEVGIHVDKRGDGSMIDPLGVTLGSATYAERQYFESHATGTVKNPGCWDVIIDGIPYHAAHHLVDYVKIWDVPKDVKVPNFPQ
jgi:hypothetical protein